MQIHHLYSDGNYFPRAKKSGFGGYILSPKGEILIEYSEQIKDAYYSHSFELFGIIRGLELAIAKGIDRLVSHCDEKNTAAKLKEIFTGQPVQIPDNGKPELYEKIIQLSKNFKELSFEYIPRSQNKHADSLSRKYADMMEQNFLRQYDKALDVAHEKLQQGDQSIKRIYFSHPCIVRNPHKSNPFLVAPCRNKKVRKVSREQQQKEYDFFYTEMFKEEELIVRGFYYNSKHQLIEKLEERFPANDAYLPRYCQFVSQNLQRISQQYATRNIWIDSNQRSLNAFFEQKEKLPGKHWEDFLMVHKTINHFSSAFFHHFPFDHQFSPEIREQEKVKEKIDTNITGLDNLLEQLNEKVFDKQRKRCFGAIIRHQLRNYRSVLQRELKEIEKGEIIRETAQYLASKGYADVPSLDRHYPEHKMG